jgi:galactose mutarotase-like enzyme
MPVHGFASSSRFEPIVCSDSSATFELCASAATLAHFPFHFRLLAHYSLSPSGLRIELDAQNIGDEVMPYACGLHPGFAWPLAGGSQADWAIRFSHEEKPSVPVIGEGGLFSSQQRPIPLEGRLLRLEPALFAREALCFLDARSSAVTFLGPGGEIEAEAENFRHWALWSRPGAPFLCIEAWTGYGDPEGFAGEFKDKPSIDILAPGEARRHALSLRFSRP